MRRETKHKPAHIYVCVCIYAHTHKKLICLPTWIILLSYDPESRRQDDGHSLQSSVSEGAICLLWGAGMGHLPRVVVEITYFQQEDERAKSPESKETPLLPKHPHHAGVTRSQSEGSAQPEAATEAAMELVSSCSPATARRGFLHPPHSPAHRASTAAGNFTKLLRFIHVCTFGYVYTYADTGPHISDIFICCNVAYTVNTSVLLQ